MSHIETIELEINDLESLEKAAKELGLELVKGQKTYKWFGRSVGDYPIPAGIKVSDLGKCDHAIRIPNNNTAYEIGVVKNKTGDGYTLLWDFWAGGYGMQEKVGPKAVKLQQAYTIARAKKHFKKQGLRVRQAVGVNGTVILRAC